jgi:steroid delta-isomerase-like uncharacterized protein
MSPLVPPAEASNIDLVRWAFDRLNEHDAWSVKQLWTSETLERFPDRTCRGRDDIAEYFEDAFRAMPDFHLDIISIAGQDDHVFVQWHLTGTHRGVLLGVDATGKALSIDGVDHFILRDGNVVSNFVIFDQMQYARQIGMLPPDASVADRALKLAFNARTKLLARLRRRSVMG